MTARHIITAVTAFAILAAFGCPSPAQASDPLCKKLKSKLERDQCECSASTGGRVEEKDGKVTYQIPSRNQFPPWRACLVARGHAL